MSSLIIKDCPCCGGKAEKGFTDWTKEYSIVECTKCGLQSYEIETEYYEEIVHDWNQRVDGWIDVEDELPVVPEGDHAIGVLAVWYCCSDEPEVVSDLSYSKRDKEFRQLAYGPDGCRWLSTKVLRWKYFPRP